MNFTDRATQLNSELGQFTKDLKPRIEAWVDFVNDFTSRYKETNGKPFPWDWFPEGKPIPSSYAFDFSLSLQDYFDGSNLTFTSTDYDGDPISWSLPLRFLDDPEAFKVEQEAKWVADAVRVKKDREEAELQKKKDALQRLQAEVEKAEQRLRG